MTDPEDARFVDRALELAASAYGCTSPNPMVGAVVVREGRILGTAAHQRAGAPHAEPQALAAAFEADVSTASSSREWTLYLNLEPCAHHGRTPPCVEAIVTAPVRRVVASLVDPDPRVAGRGFERLRSAGIAVDIGCRAAERRSSITCSSAASGAAGRSWRSRWRSPPMAASQLPTAVRSPSPARRRGATCTVLRAGLDAILVGVETLRRDRPRLDRRLYDGPGRAPRRLVLDPDLRADPEWLWPGEPRGVLFCKAGARDARGTRLERVADLVTLPECGIGLDLAALPDALVQLDLGSVLVEGGGRTHRACLEAGLWDRMYVYRNPRLALGGLPWAAAPAWDAACAGLAPHARRDLDGDELEIWEHPLAAPQF
jgi:diaminohydroxyphosphoribosylaminopyrimidine deaminase/5-amino-6-(5-phosphoribosylamino)uracil reductase